MKGRVGLMRTAASLGRWKPGVRIYLKRTPEKPS